MAEKNNGEAVNQTLNQLLERVRSGEELAPPGTEDVAPAPSHANPNTVEESQLESMADAFEEIESEEDMAAVVSLMVSLLATAVASTFSGYPRAVRDDMVPQITREMLKRESTGVEAKHVRLVNRLLRPVLNKVVQADESVPPEAFKLPAKAHTMIVQILSFGLAMHTLGKQGMELKFETGLKHGLLATALKIAQDSGVMVNKGDAREAFIKLVDEAVDAARQLHNPD